MRRASSRRKNSTSGRSRSRPPRQRSLFFRAVYKGLVVSVWLAITLLVALAWFAYDLPDPDGLKTAVTRRPTITVLAADGSEIGRRGEFYGDVLSLKEISLPLVTAVLAIEDRRFYKHWGIDPRGLIRATYVNLRAGAIRQGGSTITQQVAKNLFLTRARTFRRKIQEVILALWLERHFTKDEILEIYLNRVYLGSGSYGVDAASVRYFGKSARELSLYEGAVIAGLLKAPSRDNPRSSIRRATMRADRVLRAMVSAGWLSDNEIKKALKDGKTTMKVVPHARLRTTKLTANVGSGYFTDWVIEQVESYVGLLDRDLVIHTTLEPGLQSLAESVINQALRSTITLNGAQGALVAMAPNGAITAMVGGRDYRASQFNRASRAERQPGSVFKLFVYLAALEAGIRPDSVIIDEPVTVEGWTPRNAGNRHRGKISVREGFARSINAVAVALSERVGRESVVDIARRLGISTKLTTDPSLALGVHEVNLLELTGAYTIVANGGYGIWPHGIKSIRDRDQTILYVRRGGGSGRIIATDHVKALNDMLAAVISWGTGKAARLSRPAAGKTGTSQGNRDAWFVGYTPELVAGVWFGKDDARPMDRMTGGSLAAPVWRHFMTKALIDVTPSVLLGVGARSKTLQ